MLDLGHPKAYSQFCIVMVLKWLLTENSLKVKIIDMPELSLYETSLMHIISI